MNGKLTDGLWRWSTVLGGWLSVMMWVVVFTTSVNAAQPVVSTPELLPSLPPAESAFGMQLGPNAAAGGGMVLVVWADSRTSVSHGGLDDQTGQDVYATRLWADGTPIDTTPIVVNQGFGYQRAPVVAFNGTHWLVVWENQGATQGYYATEYQAARVSLDGTVLDSSPISVHAFESSTSGMFAVTAVGSQWVVVTQGTSAGESSIYGRRISSEGLLLDNAPVVMLPATYYLYFYVGVTSANGEVLLSWQGNNGMVARRYSATLAPLAPAFPIPGDRVVSSGSAYLVAWVNNYEIRVTPMSAQGVVQFPLGKVVVSNVAMTTGGFRAAWDGSHWWVAYSSVINGIWATAVDTAGNAVPGSAQAITTEPTTKLGAFGLAGFGPGKLAAVWEGRPVTPNDTSIWAGSTTIAGVVSAPLAVSLGAPAQLFPDVAFAPYQRLHVWVESTGSQHQVLAQRLSLLGYPLDPEPLVLDQGTGLFTTARVAFDGTRWMVAWVKDSKAYVRRVSVSGALIDTAPSFVSNAYSVDIAGGAGLFYLTYNIYVSYPQQVFVFGIMADGATGALVTNTAVNIGGTYAMEPRVERWDDLWVVTWQAHFSHNDPTASTVFTILSADGKILSSGGTGYGGNVAFAPGPETGLVVWRANSLANANNDVHCMAISKAGEIVGGPTVVSAAPYRQLRPVATWTGEDFLVVWEDQRNAATFFDYRSSLYGARVSSAGTLIDTTSFPVALGPLPVVDAQLATTDTNHTLLVASFFMDEAPYAAYRFGQVHMGKSLVPGDIDLDGDVDQGDVKLQRTCYGKNLSNTPKCTMGDLDLNGKINQSDWVAIRKLAGGN